MAANYTYQTHTHGGMTLRIISTHASNIKLENTVENGAAKTVKNAGEYGINGAFFVQIPQLDDQYTNMVLNIAYYHGNCLFTSEMNYNDAFGNDIGKGVIGWDGSSVKFDPNIPDASYLDYVVKSNSWAQGGVALWLGDNDWKDKFDEQVTYDLREGSATYRTAMVCDLNGDDMVYLIVTKSIVNIENFRKAIQDFFDINDSGNANNRYQGILLDGGKSTQMYFGSSINFSGERAIPEIIAVRNKD